MDEEAYAGDDEEHHEGELIEDQGEVEVEGADCDPFDHVVIEGEFLSRRK